MGLRNQTKCCLIIFDFDGVLADSKEAYAMQMQETVEHFSGKRLSDRVFKERVGNTDQKQDFIEFLENDDPELLDSAIQYYVDITDKYSYLRSLYSGVSETLEELKKTNFIGLVSRKSQDRMDKWLQHFKITHLFDKPIGTLEKTKSKAITQIMKEFEISNNRTLMVGDTEFDIQSAQQAHVKTVFAQYGAAMPEKVLKLNPDYVIDNISELVPLVNSLKDT
jgi:phosphoglycolate phosphatase-like HAD superfamily hydrolase